MINYANGAPCSEQSKFDQVSRYKNIFIMDANPILAEGLASVLSESQHLSDFIIHVHPMSGFTRLDCQASDIVIVDPAQVLNGLRPEQGCFQDRTKTASMIGYCHDVGADDLAVFRAEGFRAIMPRSVPRDELLRIVCLVAFGGEYFQVDVEAVPKVETAVDLSDRELAVLRNLAMGVPTKQIAAILDISAKTVDTYKTRANRKLKLNSRADIVQFAIRSGWMN